MKKSPTLDPTAEAKATEDTAMQGLRNTQTRRPRTRQLAALVGVVALLLALATGAALRQAAPASPASHAPAGQVAPRSTGRALQAPAAAPAVSAALPDTPRLQPRLAQVDAMLYGPLAPGVPAGLPDTPRQQQRLAWLDALYNGPADGDAPPPQDDGHHHGPR